jgi:hypothetical protein
MSHSFKLSRRIARFRLPAVALLMAAVFGCDNANSFNSDSSAQSGLGETISDNSPVPEGAAAPMNETEISSASLSFAGGIPIGSTAQPNDAFGSVYNGALRNIFPEYLSRDLSAIKSRGGRIALMMAGPDFHYKDADGHFSLTKWKARIDRYRNTNFNSYVTDGTIIGHYLIDEPNDPANWNGRTIDGNTLDEMARYSKSKWPNLPTIVRTQPDYLERWGPYRYLDAAWAQYVERKGNVNDYLNDNVASAKRQGLGLVVGLNYLKGGVNNREMTASQVKSWGTAMLASTYPCAFISWKYDSHVLSSSAMKDAMNALRNKAENRSSKSCKG